MPGILQYAATFVRKEVSIANSPELTKLYNPLTLSLRLHIRLFATIPPHAAA